MESSDRSMDNDWLIDLEVEVNSDGEKTANWVNIFNSLDAESFLERTVLMQTRGLVVSDVDFKKLLFVKAKFYFFC